MLTFISGVVVIESHADGVNDNTEHNKAVEPDVLGQFN